MYFFQLNGSRVLISDKYIKVKYMENIDFSQKRYVISKLYMNY